MLSKTMEKWLMWKSCCFLGAMYTIHIHPSLVDNSMDISHGCMFSLQSRKIIIHVFQKACLLVVMPNFSYCKRCWFCHITITGLVHEYFCCRKWSCLKNLHSYIVVWFYHVCFYFLAQLHRAYWIYFFFTLIKWWSASFMRFVVRKILTCINTIVDKYLPFLPPLKVIVK